MSLTDTKRNVFTTVGAFVSLNEEADLPEPTDSFTSVNNSRNALPFLLDLLKVVVGSEALKDLIGGLFTDFVDDANPQAKTFFKKQTNQYNNNDPLPSNFNNGGINVPIQNIDLFGKYKTTPDSDVGKLLYGDNTDSFDHKLHQAISIEGTDVEYGGIIMNYNSTNETVNLRNGSSETTIGGVVDGLIDETEFINKKEFLTAVTNELFGTATVNQDKSIKEIVNEEKVKTVIRKFANNEQDTVLTQEDLDEIESRADNLKRGVITYDFGCNIVESKKELDEFSSFINEINESNDAFTIGNKFEEVIDVEENQEVIDENRQTVKDGFFSRLINIIKEILVLFLVASPIARLILILIDIFSGGDGGNADVEQMRSRNKVFIECLVNDINSQINQFIYTIIVSALTSLLNPIIRRIVREKINNYLRVIRSLIGGI